MDGARLSRLHWRLSGAWLWPTFALLTVVDAIVGHVLPPEGDSQSIGSAWVVAVVLMLIGIVVVAPGVALVLRRADGSMPRVVAHNYAATGVILVISAALLGVGLAHRATVSADRTALTEAVRRAEVWMAVRAPREFRADVLDGSVYTIQDASIYRICVPSHVSTRTYCVVVKLGLPRPRSVRFAGYEPNSVLSAGTN